LRAAERRERLAGRVVVGSSVVGLTLMFIGGSRLLGDFDPWSKDATVVSVAAGVIYLLATALFFLSLASYFSRFRPRVRDAKERIRDLILLDLQRQLRELREQVGRGSPRDGPDPNGRSPAEASRNQQTEPSPRAGRDLSGLAFLFLEARS
jgi:hypothetical protein